MLVLVLVRVLVLVQVLVRVLALVLSAIGIPMPPPPNANAGYIAQIRLVGDEIALAAVTAVLATSLACLWPAWRASRVPVVQALRAGV